MNLKLFQAVLMFITAPLALISCSSGNSGTNPQDPEDAIRAAAAELPKKIDAATTVIEVRSDGNGGIINVVSVDTTIANMPSTDELKHILCDVTASSPPPGSRNPFSGVTYIYRDLGGNELANLHFGRGECQGQAL